MDFLGGAVRREACRTACEVLLGNSLQKEGFISGSSFFFFFKI